MSSFFWEQKPLTELSKAQWESLCDGCGKCCLVKLQDDETDAIAYTNVACELLNTETCQCSDYAARKRKKPECTLLTVDDIPAFHWLPATCAYRLVAENKPLPAWHHLVSGDTQAVHTTGNSVAKQCISEAEVAEDEIFEYIIRWVD